MSLLMIEKIQKQHKTTKNNNNNNNNNYKIPGLFGGD
jgi:hypothetical protein